jgi:hypothetical protein
MEKKKEVGGAARPEEVGKWHGDVMGTAPSNTGTDVTTATQ